MKPLGNCTPINCPKSGIKIHESNNDYKINPFSQDNPFSSNKNNQLKKSSSLKTINTLDLDIDNYSLTDLYQLFGINESILSDEVMKESKQKVLKTHPDKSNIEPKYFLFFSKAYKRLYSIYEFQNKSSKKEIKEVDSFTTENGALLNNMFDKNKELKNPKQFNKWFNEQFDKHKLEDINENGYGEWLKSEEGIYDTSNVTKANMAQEFEKQKKQIQNLTIYHGIGDNYSSTFGGSILGEQNNYTSETDNGLGYTDLRQAYVESVIPITNDDYNKMPKFRNVEEYKNHRNNVDTRPIDKDIALKQLYQQNQKEEQESVALAFHYAKQLEKSKKNNDSFWSGLKQLTNF